MGTQMDEVPKASKVKVGNKTEKEGGKEPLKVKKGTKKDELPIAWIGNLDKELDQKKFEKDTHSKVKLIKAYGITDDDDTTVYPSEHGRNFKQVVTEVIENDDVDILVLHGGSVEITNIKVNESIMDTMRDIEEHKNQWFCQAEEDSKELFNIAEDALKQKPNIKIIIMKRLPRFDRSSQDIIGIKSKISDFANSALDQVWVKRGSPHNNQIVQLDFIQGSNHLKSLVYGSPESHHVDGIHLRGREASRHFTYRAIQAMQPLISPKGRKVFDSSPKFPRITKPDVRRSEKMRSEINISETDHTDCEQARYARGRKQRTYAQAVIQGGPSYRTYRGENIYNHLNY